MAATEKYTADDLFDASILNRIKDIDISIKALNESLKMTAAEGDKIKNSLSGIKGTSGGDMNNRQQSVDQLAKKAAELNILEEKRLNLVSQRAKVEEQATSIREKRDNQKIKNEKELETIEEKRAKRAERDKTFDPTSMRGMEQQLSKLRNEYTQLTKAERENYELGGKKLKQINQLANETDKLRTATGSYQQRVGSYSKSMREVSSVMLGQIGLYGGIAGGVMLVSNALTSGFNIIKNYSLEWSKLKGLMGDMSAEDEKALQSSRNAGANLGQSATDVTKLQIELARFGLTAKEIVATTPGILKLATATGEDLGGASELVASNLKAFNLEAGQSDRLVGVLARAFNESALGLSNFAEAAKYSSTASAMAGVSFERMTAMLSVLSDRGIKGSTAGTGMRMILTEMQKTGLGADEALKKLAKTGITINQANEEVGRTAQNALLILTQQMDLVDKRTGMYEDQAKNAMVLNSTISVMTDNLSGDVNKLSAAWEAMWINVDKGDGIISKISRKLTVLATDIIKLFDDPKLMAVANIKKDYDQTNQIFKDDKTQSNQYETFILMQAKEEINLKSLNALNKEYNKLTFAERSQLRKEFKANTPEEILIRKAEIEAKIQSYRDIIKSYNKTVVAYDPTKTIGNPIKETKNEIDALQNKMKLEKDAFELSSKNDKERYEFRKKYGLLTSNEQMEAELVFVRDAMNKGWILLEEYYKEARKIRAKYSILDDGSPLSNTDIFKAKEGGSLKNDFGKENPIIGDSKNTTIDLEKKLQEYLGFNDLQMSATKDALGKTFGYMTDVFNAAYEVEYNHYDKLYELRTDNLNNLNDKLNQQINLQKTADENGDAFNDDTMNSLKKQIAEEERLRQDALKKREEAAKKQRAIETITQASALITTSATILKDYTMAFPIYGTLIAAGVIATMFASFAATKIKANQLTKAEHGTFKILQGDSHASQSGGMNLGEAGIMAEGREGIGIYSRNAMQKYGKGIENFTKLANEGKLENYFSLGNKNFANFNQINTNFDTSKMVSEQRKTNEYLSKQLTVLPDGKIMDTKGNTLKYL